MVNILTKVRAIWPDAQNIRFVDEDGCPQCRSWNFVTFELPQYQATHLRSDGSRWKDCGYYCADCGWSIAGSRPL